MVKNLDNAGKFLMYPRSLEIQRVGKGFSIRETPLFPTMVVQNQAEIEQDRGNINKTKSKATPNEPSSLGTSSGGGPRRQETIGDTIAQTRSENVSKLSNDLLLARGENKEVSDKDVNLSVDEVTLV
ncbi:hypothetical protein Tco_0006961 [Tanacetum coccineum]